MNLTQKQQHWARSKGFGNRCSRVGSKAFHQPGLPFTIHSHSLVFCGPTSNVSRCISKHFSAKLQYVLKLKPAGIALSLHDVIGICFVEYLESFSNEAKRQQSL